MDHTAPKTGTSKAPANPEPATEQPDEIATAPADELRELALTHADEAHRLLALVAVEQRTSTADRLRDDAQAHALVAIAYTQLAPRHRPRADHDRQAVKR